MLVRVVSLDSPRTFTHITTCCVNTHILTVHEYSTGTTLTCPPVMMKLLATAIVFTLTKVIDAESAVQLSLVKAEAMEASLGEVKSTHRRTQAGLLPGPDLPAVNDGNPPINEPCYTHGGQCEGYLVCCLTRGTCLDFGGIISSNDNYYEGGCSDLEGSSDDAWENPECTEQGECHIPYLEQVKGGVAADGLMTDVPSECVFPVQIMCVLHGVKVSHRLATSANANAVDTCGCRVLARLSQTGTPSTPAPAPGGGGWGGGGGHGGSGSGSGSSCYDMTGAIGGTPHTCLCTADICANEGAACTAGGGIWAESCAAHCECPAPPPPPSSCYDMTGAIGGTPHTCLCSAEICANDGAACTAGGGIWTDSCDAHCACPEASAACDGDVDASGSVDVNDLL